MKRIGAFMLIICLLLGAVGCGAKDEWQEQYDLGVRYLSEDNYEEAILAFTAAIEIDPKRAEAYVGRGDATISSEETEAALTSAVDDYETALELDTSCTDAWLGLADIYIHTDEHEKAKEVLQQGLEYLENSEELYRKLEEVEGESANHNVAVSSNEWKEAYINDVNAHIDAYGRNEYIVTAPPICRQSAQSRCQQIAHVHDTAARKAYRG